MIRKILLILFVSLCYISCGKSTLSEENGLLWKVSGNGLKHSSYLLGTDHLTPASFLDSIPGFYNAFESVNQFACEKKSDDSDFLKNLSEVKMPDDTIYADLLNKEELMVLDSVLFKYFSAGSDQFYIKPVVLSFLLSSMKSIEQYPEYKINLDSMMDGYLQKLAIEQGNNIIELDNESLIPRMCLQPLKKQAEELMFLITHHEFFSGMEERMNKLYKEQDLMGLEKEGLVLDSIAKTFKISPAEDLILKGRNLKWMQKIPSLIKDKSTFIAVGAMHLVGETGLIHQLRELGYTVEPVK